MTIDNKTKRKSPKKDWTYPSLKPILATHWWELLYPIKFLVKNHSIVWLSTRIRLCSRRNLIKKNYPLIWNMKCNQGLKVLITNTTIGTSYLKKLTSVLFLIASTYFLSLQIWFHPNSLTPLMQPAMLSMRHLTRKCSLLSRIRWIIICLCFVFIPSKSMRTIQWIRLCKLWRTGSRKMNVFLFFACSPKQFQALMKLKIINLMNLPLV